MLLVIAVLGLAICVPVALLANNRNRVDAEATMLAQSELEQILAQPLTATSFVDASSNTVSLGAGGCSLVNGKIDFSQAAVAGYNATVSGSKGARYDLRWYVQSLADTGKQFNIAARRTGSQGSLLSPVNLAVRLGR